MAHKLAEEGHGKVTNLQGEGGTNDDLKNEFGSLVISYKSLTLGEVIGEGQ